MSQTDQKSLNYGYLMVLPNVTVKLSTFKEESLKDITDKQTTREMIVAKSDDGLQYVITQNLYPEKEIMPINRQY